MNLKDYLLETKKLKNTMIGFGFSDTKVKRLKEYVKSWLDRYKINYNEEKNPHFTIAQITSKYPKDELVRYIQKTIKHINLNPKNMAIFRGKRIPKDFIVLEYKTNISFKRAFEDISSNFEVFSFNEVKPHATLFIVEQNTISNKMFQDMLYSLPKIPSIKTETVELWNDKFKKDFFVK